MNDTAQIQRDLNDRKPLTVAAIADSKALDLSTDTILKMCDIVELRLDSLGWNEKILSFAKKCPTPLLVTARGAAEGGANELSLKQRAEAYRTLMPYASLIDIEMRNFNSLESILTEAKKSNITVVGSFHNFEKTPPLPELRAKLNTPADIHKFALKVQKKEDLQTLLALLTEDQALSVMGMGALGSASRPLMAEAGSILNYGYAGETPTAPGQWPAALLKQTLNLSTIST